MLTEAETRAILTTIEALKDIPVRAAWRPLMRLCLETLRVTAGLPEEVVTDAN